MFAKWQLGMNSLDVSAGVAIPPAEAASEPFRIFGVQGPVGAEIKEAGNYMYKIPIKHRLIPIVSILFSIIPIQSQP